jgi:hypothetical protein
MISAEFLLCRKLATGATCIAPWLACCHRDYKIRIFLGDGGMHLGLSLYPLTREYRDGGNFWEHPGSFSMLIDGQAGFRD